MSVARIQASFNEATSLHQKGRLSQAKALYEAVLKLQPTHFQSIHLLGVIAAQTGNYQHAVDLIGKAIQISPNNADFHLNQGNALRALKQLDAAVASYDKAIAIKLDYAEAHSNRAAALQGLGQFNAAVTSYDKAILIKPDFAEAHSNRGVALLELQQLEAAVASCDKAVELRPTYAEAHFNRGNALFKLDQLDAALACYDKAVAISPVYAQAHFSRGAMRQALNQLDQAIASYDQALSIRPKYVEAHYYRGVALQALGQPEAAIAGYDEALAIDPEFAEAYSNRGVALLAVKQLDAAVESFDKAIGINPKFAEAYTNRGVALHELQQLDAAINNYDKAIAIRPDYVEAHTNRGVALLALRQLDAAIASYDSALSIEPNYAEAHFYKSFALLLQGNFEAGWQEYQWLWKTKKSAPKLRHFSQPTWSGAEALIDKSILIHSEQGLGDMIQFCRYVKALHDLGARVILEAPAQLVGLLTGLEGVSELVIKGDPLRAFDYHSLLLALPLAFKTNLATIPGTQPYLRSDRNKVDQWANRLGPKTKPRVGIVWSGSTEHAIDYNRSIALSTIVPYLVEGFEYVSLQKEVRDVDRNTLERHSNIRHFETEITDFSDTAALCELMDLVVSVDTSVAHLGGALGRPTWVLLPFVPDWRWLLDRGDSPWYPSVKLYRQTGAGDWDEVLATVSEDLIRFAP